jgi:O-antigen ligase
MAAVIARFLPAIIRALYYTALASPALLIISTILSPEARQQAQQTANIVAAIIPITFLAVFLSMMLSMVSMIRELGSQVVRRA